MPTVNDIPLQIIWKILEYVRVNSFKKQESLAQCALTCRSWRVLSQRLFFKAISVRYKVELTKANRVLRLQRKDDISLGVYVQQLHYKSFHNSRYGLSSYQRGLCDTFLQIDKLFPNLQVFVYEPGYCIDVSFCLLYGLMLDGYFKALKQVPSHMYARCKSTYQCGLHDKCVQMIKERNGDDN